MPVSIPKRIPLFLLILMAFGCEGPTVLTNGDLPAGNPAVSVGDLLEEGNRLYREERYEEAGNCYSKVIQSMGAGRDPNIHTAHFNRGLVFLACNRFREAIPDFTAAIDGNGEDVTAFHNRGQSYEGIREYGRAVADYSKAISLNPRDARLYMLRGHAYRKWGRRYDPAIADFLQAVRLDSGNPKAYYALGMSYFMKADYERAIESLSRAILIQPEDGKCYNGRGQSFLRKGHLTKALDDFGRACELGEESGCIMLAYLTRQGNTCMQQKKERQEKKF